MQVVHFGKFASGIYIFGQLGKGAPEMVIGKAMDMAATGMFSRAQGLIEIFNRLVLRAIMPVYLPYFAKAVRETGSPKAGLLQAMSYLTAVGWPFLAFVGIAAYPAIRLVYGPQWLEAVPLARVLCAVAALEMIYVASKECMLARGLVKQSNSLQVVIQLLRVAGLLAVFKYGLAGASWGLFVSAVIGTVVSHRFVSVYVGVRIAEVLLALRPSLMVAAITVAPLALWALFKPIDETNYVWLVVVNLLLSCVLWLGALKWMHHPLWPELVRMAAGARKRWKNSEAPSADGH
jgi:O-antigen/teichoic acid export membrane protein